MEIKNGKEPWNKSKKLEAKKMNINHGEKRHIRGGEL
jgi:hypothetical protein